MHLRNLYWALAVTLLCTSVTAGCGTLVRPTLPGQTAYEVRSIDIVGDITLDWAPLKPLLGVRPDVFLRPAEPYNPYRTAEDVRRIAVFWQSHGHFDVAVDDVDVRVDEPAQAIDITWRITEGPRYHIRDVRMEGAPPAAAAALARQIPMSKGAPATLRPYRWARHGMADHLRRRGWLRAEVISRAFVDRATKEVDWVYFVDAGPRSHLGTLTVVGNRAIPEAAIRERIGLVPGQPLDFGLIETRERDLMDTGAFAMARLYADYGTEFVMNAAPPDAHVAPDTGGRIAPERVSADGAVLPRPDLSAAVDLTVTVTEAPPVQGEVGVGIGADPERVDPFASAELQLRNAFGPLHHLTMRGRVGYGIRWRGDIEEPLGLSGGALLRYTRPGVFGRIVDLRVTGRFDEALYVGHHQRSLMGTVGLRATVTDGVFVDLSPRVRADWPVGLGTIAPEAARALSLNTADVTVNGELAVALTWDARDNGFEALAGHLIAARLEWAPGGPLGETPWIRGELDLRYIMPIGQNLGLAFRGFAGWADALDDTAGLPVAARLFGGGAYGVRGFGTRRLAPTATRCLGPERCSAIPAGGLSLAEASAELRWLPFRQPFGATAFVDVGNASLTSNPFEDGASVALGVGLRVRTWHLPVALDLAYRVTDLDAYGALDRFFAFVRVAEAF